MLKNLPLILAIIALALLVFFCTSRADLIQSDLVSDVRIGLADADLSTVGAAIDGREIQLAGTVADEQARQRAEDVARSVWGVSGVDNQIEIRRLEPAAFTIAYERSVAVLTGRVPSQAMSNRLVESAVALYGEERVRNQLEVAEAASQTWLERLPEGLEGWATAEGDLLSTSMSFLGDQLTLRGTVPRAAIRDAIGTAATAAFPDTRIDNQIEVIAAERQVADVLELENIEFLSGSDRLTPEGRSIVERVRAILSQLGEFQVEVSGHTDSEGDANFNRSLSRRRALTVVNALAQTLPRESFTVVGLGEERPIADKRNRGRPPKESKN